MRALKNLRSSAFIYGRSCQACHRVQNRRNLPVKGIIRPVSAPEASEILIQDRGGLAQFAPTAVAATYLRQFPLLSTSKIRKIAARLFSH